VTELSGYALSPLLHRGLGDGLASILLIAPAGEYPSPGSLQCLEHGYALRTDLDGDWSARPVELLRREGRLMVVLADPGGEPLERLLGRPMQVTQFLRIAVPLAVAVGRLHAEGLSGSTLVDRFPHRHAACHGARTAPCRSDPDSNPGVYAARGMEMGRAIWA
jgi:hypothetical protein